MKALPASKLLAAAALYLGFLAGVFLLVWPDFHSKNIAQKMDRHITMAADWEDVAAFENSAKPEDVLVKLQAVPIQMVLLPSAATLTEEAFVRAAGFQVIWRLNDDVRPREWLPRFQKGDAVFLAGEHVLEHPLLLKELPNLLRAQQGFLCAMEFHPDALMPVLARQVPGRVLKGHILPTREIIYAKADLWRERLWRAVESRWVRLLVVRFSPAWSIDANVDFQSGIARELKTRGYEVSAPTLFPLWSPAVYLKWRLLLVLLISFLTPVVILLAARSLNDVSPWTLYLGMNLCSLFAGMVIHGLGASPASVLGLQMVRGVKLQLVVPLFLAAAALCSQEELRRWLEWDIKVKHVAIAGVFLAALLGIYLMRSGNFPLIPVTDAERHLRDVLEQILIARPRFKEFMIGQPLLLLGLMKKNRLLLWLGIIGQISILNTFTHFHSPFNLGLVRTLHGIWLGGLIAWPLSKLMKCRT